MADVTLDPRAQLLQGLRVLVEAVLAGRSLPGAGAATASVITGWHQDSAQQVRSGVVNPVVAIWLGDSKPAKPLATGTGLTSRTRRGPVTVTDQAELVTLVEVVRLQTPVWFVILAGGTDGRTLAGRAASAIVTALVQAGSAQGATIPLPDSLETFETTNPALTDFGLTARLTYVSEGEVIAGQQTVRDLHRYDLRYSALHSRYIAQEDLRILSIHQTLEAGTTVVPSVPLPTPLP